MTPDRWQRLSELFHAARELDPAKRDEYLRRECAGDETMRLEVVRWLEEDTKDSGLLDHPIWPEHESGQRPAIAFASGDIVSDRYRIIRFIARGGMGEVYEAEDLELKCHVALKTLLPQIASDARMIARFKQEIQLSRKIAHPNVCKVYDLVRHPAEGSPAQVILLSMEYLPGETLAKMLDLAGPMSENAALPIVRQMAAALDAAHAAGVIHRDFKPSNVMVAPADQGLRVVVTDFGLARSASAEGDSTASLSRHVAGTLDYMAPELLSGGTATVASEVYALGMVLYRMVTGTRPFATDEAQVAAVRRVKEPVPAPRTVIPALEQRWDDAIVRCLDADPARRFASAGDVVRALEGQSVAMPPRKASAATRRRMAGTAALLIVLAALGSYAFWPRIYQPPVDAARLYRTGTDNLEAGAYFAATKELGEAARVAPDFSMAHARLAEAWTELESQEKASQEMLLARRAATGVRLSRLDRLYLDAVELAITRQFPEAARKYAEMLKYAGVTQPEVRLDVGRASERAGKPDEALQNYLIAAKGPPRNPAAWLRAAILYSQKSDSKNADEAFGQADQLYEMSSNQEGLTEVAYQRGVAANKRGEMQEAKNFSQQALRMAQVTRNVQQEIRAKLQLGTTAFLSGDGDAAQRYAQEAIDTAQLHGIESLATHGLLQLGDAFRRKRDFKQAEQYYARGLGFARQDDSQRMVAAALLRLASLHDEERQIDKSGREAQEALPFFQQNNFARETMQGLLLIGRAREDQGDYNGALEIFQQRLAVAEKLQDRFQMMLTQEAMGHVQLLREEYPEALGHYQKDWELGSALRDAEHMGYGALGCGAALWPLGRYTEAKTRFDQAEGEGKKFEDLRLIIEEQRAEMALSEGKYPEAIATCNRLFAKTPKDERDTLADLNRVMGLALLRTGRKREGRQHCEHSFTIAAVPNGGAPPESTLAVAEARLETGDWKGVLTAVQAANERLSKLADSGWRANAMEARASEMLGDRGAAKRFALEAQAKLSAIEHQWGGPAFQLYRGRADLQRLWRPLSGIISASQ